VIVLFGEPSLSQPPSEALNLFAGSENERLAWGWALLRAAARSARAGPPRSPGAFGLDRAGRLRPSGPGVGQPVLEWGAAGGWTPVGPVTADLEALFDLYLPVCNATAEAPLTIGHLGQSLDGYIATGTGDSNYVTGSENIVHLHRMRALCDAVVVGAGTVSDDDPRLTARLADGENPVRVVLDPSRRLAAERNVFVDGNARTLLVCDEALLGAGEYRSGAAELVGVGRRAGRLDLAALVVRLRARGLYAIFIEGGGVTVSSFLEAGLLDRLQVAIASLVTGSGRPGIRLPANERIGECLRPSHRIFAMGADVLFDCDLRSPARDDAQPKRGGLRRIY